MPTPDEVKLRKKAVIEAKKSKQVEKALRKSNKKFGISCNSENLNELKNQVNSIIKSPLARCPPPSRRSASSLTLISEDKFFVFGGEWYNGSKSVAYNEAYIWNLEKNTWKISESSRKPPPRCSHQALHYNKKVYIFGGECIMKNKCQHFNDLWFYDIKTGCWEELFASGPKPSPRSGHRMVVCKSDAILFGGFYDTNKTTKYFNDLYKLCLKSFVWTEIKFDSIIQIPTPRSGFLFGLIPNDKIFLCGGFCKLKDTNGNLQEIVYQDTWLLHLKNSETDENEYWNKLGNKSNFPLKACGLSITIHKNTAYCFGGVIDEMDEDQNLKSKFLNDLHLFDFETMIWTKVDSFGPSKTIINLIKEPFECLPRPRYNASISISKQNLIVFGGVFEQGNEEYILNDSWRYNLKKNIWKSIQSDPEISKLINCSESSNE